MLHQLTKFLPTLYLILRSLYRVQTIQVVHRHAQRLTKGNICWWQHSRVGHRAVHSKFNQHESLHPILPFVCKRSDNVFNNTVLLLSLTISLRVVSATKHRLRTQQAPQCLPKGRSKMYVMVIYEILWYTKEYKPNCQKRATLLAVLWASLSPPCRVLAGSTCQTCPWQPSTHWIH